jgi:hypothetical protein
MKRAVRPKGAALLPMSAKMTGNKLTAGVPCQRAMLKKRATTKIFHLQVEIVGLPVMMRMSLTLRRLLRMAPLVRPSKHDPVARSGAMLKSWRCILNVDFCFHRP